MPSFISVLATSFGEAFSGGETSTVQPDGEKAESQGEGEEQGTRANPYPIGTAITQDDWTVTINSVNLDAASDVTEENLVVASQGPFTIRLCSWQNA